MFAVVVDWIADRFSPAVNEIHDRRAARIEALLNEFRNAVNRAAELDLSNADADRALWSLLERWKDRLPELDGYFHKCFRQCNVTDSEHEDAAIHSLLNISERFWKVFEKHRVDSPKSSVKTK